MPIIKDSIQSNTLNNFESFVRSQDIIPSKELIFPSDSLFKKAKTISLINSNEIGYTKTMFESHELQPKLATNRLNVHQTEFWVFGLVILCTIFFIGARISHAKRLSNMLNSFLADRFINQLLREGYVFVEKSSIALFINYLLSLSLFIYLLTPYISPINNLNFYFFIQILLFVFIFYMIKINLIKIIGYIFESEKESKDHILLIHIFNQIGGIFLLPVVFFSYYLYPSNSQIIIFTSLFFIIIIYLFKLFRVLLSSTNKSRFSKFYLFLYLCTLEIIPVLLVAKYLINNFKAV